MMSRRSHLTRFKGQVLKDFDLVSFLVKSIMLFYTVLNFTFSYVFLFVDIHTGFGVVLGCLGILGILILKNIDKFREMK